MAEVIHQMWCDGERSHACRECGDLTCSCQNCSCTPPPEVTIQPALDALARAAYHWACEVVRQQRPIDDHRRRPWP